MLAERELANLIGEVGVQHYRRFLDQQIIAEQLSLLVHMGVEMLD
ncbi:MAG: hypothetical protein OXU20_03650 [Myxococcales bacterium]|nr:hypothetical protein [Myxococcales bacterium]